MDKLKIQEQQKKILALLNDFCQKKLNQEYFEISERLLQKLGRKKTVPFITGQPQVWAAAIIHALGTINFLFDKSSELYVSIDEINIFFGTAKSTTGNKSKEIRDLLKLVRWDKEFSTKRMSNSNPFANLVMVNGLIVPIDSLPENYKEAVQYAKANNINISFTREEDL